MTQASMLHRWRPPAREPLSSLGPFVYGIPQGQRRLWRPPFRYSCRVSGLLEIGSKSWRRRTVVYDPVGKPGVASLAIVFPKAGLVAGPSEVAPAFHCPKCVGIGSIAEDFRERSMRRDRFSVATLAVLRTPLVYALGRAPVILPGSVTLRSRPWPTCSGGAWQTACCSRPDGPGEKSGPTLWVLVRRRVGVRGKT